MYFQRIQAYRYPIKLYETRSSCCCLEFLSADSPPEYRPFAWYVNARSAMLLIVSGCFSPSTSRQRSKTLTEISHHILSRSTRPLILQLQYNVNLRRLVFDLLSIISFRQS